MTFIPPVAVESVQEVRKVDDQWVGELLKAHPELTWLASDDVVVSQEGTPSIDPSPSTRLFGQKFNEFDRTILSIRTLEWVVRGDIAAYSELTEVQEEGRLTWNSFQKLHAEANRLLEELPLTSEEGIFLMRTALVIGDLGKTTRARALFSEITTPDHDDFEYALMQKLNNNPSLLTSFAALHPTAQQALCDSTGLAHFGHIYHCEGGPAMFKRLEMGKVQPNTLAFALFIHQCDVAGAAGHINPTSSIVLNENTFVGYEAVKAACLKSLTTKNNVDASYHAYLVIRANLLGFNLSDLKQHFLTKMGAMLRLFSDKEGQMLNVAFDSIPDGESVMQEIMTQRTITPSYMPAVLVNLMNRCEGSLQEKINFAFQFGLPLLAEGLKLKVKEDVCHCFNTLAGQVKNCSLDGGTLVIDAKGEIHLAFPIAI